MEKLAPVTPGELLLEKFLIPMGISRYRLARAIGVPPQRIGDIVAGKRAVTADADLRLCRFFGFSNGYWLRAQVAHDTEVAEIVLAEMLKKIKPWSDEAAQFQPPNVPAVRRRPQKYQETWRAVPSVRTSRLLCGILLCNTLRSFLLS